MIKVLKIDDNILKILEVKYIKYKDIFIKLAFGSDGYNTTTHIKVSFGVRKYKAERLTDVSTHYLLLNEEKQTFSVIPFYCFEPITNVIDYEFIKIEDCKFRW